MELVFKAWKQIVFKNNELVQSQEQASVCKRMHIYSSAVMLCEQKIMTLNW